jgi:hypothetical protein
VARAANNRREHRTRCIIAGEAFDIDERKERKSRKKKKKMNFLIFFFVETMRKLDLQSDSTCFVSLTRLAHARTVINHQCLHFLFHS